MNDFRRNSAGAAAGGSASISYAEMRKQEIKTIVRRIIAGVIGVLIVALIFSCLFSINEQQNGVVTQFGAMVKVETAGVHFKLPWQRVRKVDMTTHGTGIGYTVDEKGQNIVDTDNGIMITKDFNLLNIDFYLEYKVSDPVAYTYNSTDPEKIMINIARSCIRTVVSNYTVDEAMTTGKGQIQADIKEALLNELTERNLGLTVVNITIQDSEPPTPQIIAAFKSVETAKQGAQTAMNNALQYKNSQLPAAQAKADNIIRQAEADKNARIAEANGQVSRFNKIYEEYLKFPEVTKRRLFYEKIEEVFPNVKIIVTDGKTSTVYPVAPFTDNNTTSTKTITPVPTPEAK